MVWANLTEQEKEFLTKWRSASPEAQMDAFAMLVNGRRRGVAMDKETSNEAAEVVKFEDLGKRVN